jgi:hypothetical protein
MCAGLLQLKRVQGDNTSDSPVKDGDLIVYTGQKGGMYDSSFKKPWGKTILRQFAMAEAGKKKR